MRYVTALTFEVNYSLKVMELGSKLVSFERGRFCENALRN
jgi:hypothetical protein